MQNTAAAMYRPKQLVYLANATGEPTEYGEVLDADLNKVPFGDGPGYVLPYIVLIDGKKYLLGNLEVAYRSNLSGEEAEKFPEEASALAYCERICDVVAQRLEKGMLLLPIDFGGAGTFVVQVAIPLDEISGPEEARVALASAFGEHALLPTQEEDAFRLAQKQICWEISTSHICKDGDKWLSLHSDTTAIGLTAGAGCCFEVMRFEHGYVIKLIAAPWTPENLRKNGIHPLDLHHAHEQARIPASLLRLLRLATNERGRFLVLDADADAVEGLPVYDW